MTKVSHMTFPKYQDHEENWSYDFHMTEHHILMLGNSHMANFRHDF